MPVERQHIAKDLEPYACKDRPHVGDFKPIMVQDGWHLITSDETGLDTLEADLDYHKTKWNPIVCGHTGRVDDDRCGDCKWRRK